jgi:hypothetical protein
MRAGVAAATIPCMPDRVRIELLVDPSGPIRGELSAESGESREFEGWLELISAIQDSCEGVASTAWTSEAEREASKPAR